MHWLDSKIHVSCLYNLFLFKLNHFLTLKKLIIFYPRAQPSEVVFVQVYEYLRPLGDLHFTELCGKYCILKLIPEPLQVLVAINFIELLANRTLGSPSIQIFTTLRNSYDPGLHIYVNPSASKFELGMNFSIQLNYKASRIQPVVQCACMCKVHTKICRDVQE